MTPEEKAKKVQNEYKREWRKKNREKTKEYNRRYWLRKAASMEAKGSTGKDEQKN